MDEKLKATIQKIQLLAKQNPEFETEMRNLFGSREVYAVDNKRNEERIQRIEKYLGLDYYVDDMQSVIDYSFVQDEVIRAQLISDCREMMRFRYGTRYHEILFEEYCRYAQLQAEMLLNYFYTIKDNGDLSKIKEHISQYNTLANISDYKKLSAIAFNIKLWAFTSEFQLQIYDTFNNVREVRNEQSHRSSTGFDFERYKKKLIDSNIPLYNNGYVNFKELSKNMVLKNIFDSVFKGKDDYKQYLFQIWCKDKPYDSIIEALNILKNTVSNQIY